MSGEAGWTIRRPHYTLFLGSGCRVSLATPPVDDPLGQSHTYVADDYARANEPYRRWLARAEPQLDALFATLVAAGAPLVDAEAPSQEIDGILIEVPDHKADHFRRYWQGLPCPVHLRGASLMPGGQSVNLRLVVSRRVRPVELEPILARVVAVLRDTEQEPTPHPTEDVPVAPVEAEPPRPSPSFAARAWAWLTRSAK